jgi:hypothetical protein
MAEERRRMGLTDPFKRKGSRFFLKILSRGFGKAQR